MQVLGLFLGLYHFFFGVGFIGLLDFKELMNLFFCVLEFLACRDIQPIGGWHNRLSRTHNRLSGTGGLLGVA